MKAKYLVLAIPAFLLISLAMSGMASAGEVHTDWKFNGLGSITLHTEKTGSVGGSSLLYVETSGSGSSGWETAKSYPYGAWDRFEVNRYAEIEDGTIAASFEQNCTVPWWTAHTEYGALLTGGGFMGQSYKSDTYGANFQSHIEANSPHTMNAGEDSTSGGYHWNFGIGATGDSEESAAILDVNLSDRVAHGSDPRYPSMQGSFFVDANQSDAGFTTDWSNKADFGGHISTPSIEQDFGVDVSGSGFYNEFVSADRVTINGFIDWLK